MDAIFSSLYPEAKLCVDCDYVWWRDKHMPRIELSKLQKAPSDGFYYTPIKRDDDES